MLKLELNSRGEAPDASLPKGRSPEQRGRQVYQSRCKLCHGAELAGQPPAVPSLMDVGSRLSGDDVRAVVTRGRGPMPAISSLSDAALDSLVAYLVPSRSRDRISPEEAAGNIRRWNHLECSARKAPLSKQLRFYVRQQRIAGDRSALDDAYGLRSQRGHNRMASALGEVPELAAKGFKGHRFAFSQGWPGGDCWWLDFHRHTRLARFEPSILSDGEKSYGRRGWKPRWRGCRPYIRSTDANMLYSAPRRRRPPIRTRSPAILPCKRSIPGAYVAFALPDGRRNSHTRLEPW